MPDKGDKFVDVHKAIREKSPSLYAVIPNWLINWFKERIVHESYVKITTLTIITTFEISNSVSSF